MNESSNIWLIGAEKMKVDLPVPYNVAHTVHDITNMDCRGVIVQVQAQDDLRYIYNLRQNPRFRFTPIFYSGDLNVEQAALFDGLVDDEVEQKIQKIAERLQLVPQDISLSANLEMTLLIYLFSRQDQGLQSFLDVKNNYVINYPLINLFVEQEFSDTWSYLQSMVQRGLVQEKALKDEIQACPFCHSGHLNFRNSCPNCHSIDIKSEHFIHCFACGNIGPMSEFMNREQLICGRCNARLLHTGIDYDKPLEDKSCSACHHYFMEADIMVLCLGCKKLSNPEELQSRRLYEYALSKKGELYVRGIEKNIDKNFSYLFSMIAFETLLALIEWQKRLIERYPANTFSLLGLKIANMDVLVEKLGLFNTEKVVSELFGQIRTLIRKTDLVSKVHEYIIFFLPMTDLDGAKILVQKIRSFLEEQKMSSREVPIELESSIVGAEELSDSAISADLILTELTDRLENK